MMLCRNCRPLIVNGECLCTECEEAGKLIYAEKCPRIEIGDCEECVKEWERRLPEDDPDDEDLTKGE